jgi:tripartite-type tricarboxylate transporter receptor subunit TctC
MIPKKWTLPVAVVLTLVTSSIGHAQDTQTFYKGKQIRFIVGHNVGNDYDVGTRLLAKHLPKHIPGQPTIVVQNMPQAAGIAAANFLQTQAARDGTVMGTFTRNYPNQAIMKQANVEGDPRRLNWLAATSFPAGCASPARNQKSAPPPTCSPTN